MKVLIVHLVFVVFLSFGVGTIEFSFAFIGFWGARGMNILIVHVFSISLSCWDRKD